MKVTEIPTSFTSLTLLQRQIEDRPILMCESYFRQFSDSPVGLPILLEKMGNMREGFISLQNDKEHNEFVIYLLWREIPLGCFFFFN